MNLWKFSSAIRRRLETAAEYNARIAAQKAGLHQSWTGTQAEHGSALDGAKGTRSLTLRGIIAIGVAIIGLPLFIYCLEFFSPPTTTKAAEVTPVETYRRQSPELQEALTALRKIQAATQVGVAYHDYGQLLIEAKVRVNDAVRTLPEGPARDELQAATEAYVDAGRVYSLKLEQQPWLTADEEPGKTLIPKYGLPPQSKSDRTSTSMQQLISAGNANDIFAYVHAANAMQGQTYSIDEAVQAIWRAADEHLSLLDKLASGSMSAYREGQKEQQRRTEQAQKVREQEAKIASAEAAKKAADLAHEHGVQNIIYNMTPAQEDDIIRKGQSVQDVAEIEQARREAAAAAKTAKNPQDQPTP
jgi:hypothetical protein